MAGAQECERGVWCLVKRECEGKGTREQGNGNKECGLLANETGQGKCFMDSDAHCTRAAKWREVANDGSRCALHAHCTMAVVTDER
eukprot:11007159-Lingulodinium_polyedra.AAC.1